MNRIATISIALLFVLSSTGVNISWHTCGKKVSVAVNGITVNKTCKCDHNHEKHASSCCDDEHRYIKALDSDFTHTVKARPATSTIDFAVINLYSVLLQTYKSDGNMSFAFKPPPERDVSLNTIHCVFLI